MTRILESFSDESSTHDLTGRGKGAASPTMGGLIAEPAYWNKFRKKWEKILKKYDVNQFHFVDWHHKQPPYNNLDGDDHYDLVCELAALIGEVTIPITPSTLIVKRQARMKIFQKL